MANEIVRNMAGKHPHVVDAVTWILRIAVGAVFIFSGFVKAVDPWGTLYQVDAYLAAMSIDVWPNLKLAGVFALCSAEFIIGILLVAGCLRHSISVATLLFMTVMLPLTLWIAIYDPVADCGCFGDAIVIGNWATFWKNVALTLASIWLVMFNRRCHWIITPALQWIAIVVSFIFIIAIETFGYSYQPLIDFRSYPQGEPLVETDSSESEDERFLFIYEKDGIKKEFTVDDILPDESEGWKFVERKETGDMNTAENRNKEDNKNLRIFDRKGNEDVTEDVIDNEGKELLVMIPDLDKVSPSTTWRLNSLYEWSQKNNVSMIGVVSGSVPEIEEWEDLSMASYPIYTADDTHIKEVVRGNPGIVYLESGKIVWKSTLSAIRIDDFLSPDTSGNAREFGADNEGLLRNCVLIYLICMAVLVVLSFAPSLGRFIRGGRAHHAE